MSTNTAEPSAVYTLCPVWSSNEDGEVKLKRGRDYTIFISKSHGGKVDKWISHFKTTIQHKP